MTFQLNRQYNKTKQKNYWGRCNANNCLFQKSEPQKVSLSLSLVPIAIFFTIFSKFPPVL